jgi:hypothetical protein
MENDFGLAEKGIIGDLNLVVQKTKIMKKILQRNKVEVFTVRFQDLLYGNQEEWHWARGLAWWSSACLPCKRP